MKPITKPFEDEASKWAFHELLKALPPDDRDIVIDYHNMPDGPERASRREAIIDIFLRAYDLGGVTAERRQQLLDRMP